MPTKAEPTPAFVMQKVNAKATEIIEGLLPQIADSGLPKTSQFKVKYLMRMAVVEALLQSAGEK